VTKSTPKPQSAWQQEFIIAAGHTDTDRFTGVEFQWWFNPTNHYSLRLTKLGYDWTRKYSHVQYYEIKLSHGISSKNLLQLERLLHSPYYIKTLKQLMVYSDTDAIMLQLHGGNLDQYLGNLAANKD
jgi:hypothetical protein